MKRKRRIRKRYFPNWSYPPAGVIEKWLQKQGLPHHKEAVEELQWRIKQRLEDGDLNREGQTQ